MERAYQKRSPGRSRTGRAVNEAIQLMLDPVELIGQLQESVHTIGVEIGRVVASKLLEDEVQQICGERYERGGREASRHGRQRGWISMSGQKVRIEKPRMRAGEELLLDRYALMQRKEAMPEAALRRMVRGVSTRDYAGVIDAAREGFGIRRSSVSRAFVEASRGDVEELMRSRFDGVRFPAIFIDGVEYADTTMVVALGLTEDGQKRILGFREGASENAEVCKSLIDDLCERGLCRDQATLLVLDGSKALRKAVLAVWGRYAIVQRCQFHKKRNIQAHVPDRHWDEIRRRLNEAYNETDYGRAVKILKNTAALLDRISPDAAASLREGLEETLTLIRLGLPAELRVHLVSTNIIESALSTSRKVARNVKRWRTGDMRRRWCAAGLLVAQSKFRRVKGHKHMKRFVEIIDRAIDVKQSLAKTA